MNPSIRRRQITQDVGALAPGALLAITAAQVVVALQPEPGGLAAWVVRLPPSATLAAPKHAGGAGQFHIVTAGSMIGLHAGRFSSDWLRFLYFLCGVAGSVMVASGMVLWTVKRREKLPDPTRPHFGFKLVERTNVAAIAGFPLGVAVMFWANRLLPVEMAGRAAWEVHCLFLAWGAALILSIVRKPQHNWVALLGLTGVLLAALPVYNLFGTQRGLIASLSSGDMMLAGIDIALLVFGAAFLALARRVARHKPAAPRVRRRAAPAVQSAEPAAAQLEPAE